MAISQRSEEQARTDADALKLRSRGFTYPQIAENMGCAMSTAYDRVKRALAAIPYEAVEEYRRLEGERLDALLAVATHQALTGKRSLLAIDRVLAIMDRRAKLMGLDAPIRQQIEQVTYSGDAIESRLAELRAALGQLGGESLSLDERAGASRADSDRGTVVDLDVPGGPGVG